MDIVDRLKGLHGLLAAAWSPRGCAELKIISDAVEEIERIRMAVGAGPILNKCQETDCTGPLNCGQFTSEEKC